MAVSLDKQGALANIVLDKPPANTYDLQFAEELDDAINKIRLDDAIKVVVMKSAVPRFFSAGAEISMLQTSTPKYKATFCLFCQETLNKIELTPKVFIAALEGNCVGGGLEIALACDLRFAADQGVRIGLPEINLGVLPGTGGTQRLSRLIGKSRALDLMITARLVDANEAQQLGIVDRVFPKESFWDETNAYIERLINGATMAQGLIKIAVNQGVEVPLGAGLTMERELQNRLFISEDAKEGISAFTEKRAARFAGR